MSRDRVATRHGADERRVPAAERRRHAGRAVAEVFEAVASDVVGIRHLADRRAVLGDERAERGRVGLSEHEGEDVDSLRRELGPQPFAEHQVERLRRAVGDEPVATRPRRTRRDEQDPAAPTIDHRPCVVMTQTERHHAVAMDHRRPAVGVDVEELHAVLVGTGVVDQQADVEIRRSRRQARRSASSPLRSSAHGARLDARRFADLLGERVERIRAARHEHHVHALRGDLDARTPRRFPRTRPRRSPTGRSGRESRSSFHPTRRCNLAREGRHRRRLLLDVLAHRMHRVVRGDQRLDLGDQVVAAADRAPRRTRGPRRTRRS